MQMRTVPYLFSRLLASVEVSSLAADHDFSDGHVLISLPVLHNLDFGAKSLLEDLVGLLDSVEF